MSSGFRVLLSTFALLFVAELGDKTQLAVINMTAKHRMPWWVFVGASLSLTLVTALGVVGGEALTRIIPEMVLRKVAALLFVVMGLLMWFDKL
jgi:putative Ca2+/H+ antiporter (TMEM165/GDT1 family)